MAEIYRTLAFLPLAPAAGRIVARTAEREIEDGEERGRLVGWLGHHDGLKPQLTVLEQLTFFAHLYGAKADPSIGVLRITIEAHLDLGNEMVDCVWVCNGS